jgi:hypothetical protein
MHIPKTTCFLHHCSGPGDAAQAGIIRAPGMLTPRNTGHFLHLSGAGAGYDSSTNPFQRVRTHASNVFSPEGLKVPLCSVPIPVRPAWKTTGTSLKGLTWRSLKVTRSPVWLHATGTACHSFRPPSKPQIWCVRQWLPRPRHHNYARAHMKN